MPDNGATALRRFGPAAGRLVCAALLLPALGSLAPEAGWLMDLAAVGVPFAAFAAVPAGVWMAWGRRWLGTSACAIALGAGLAGGGPRAERWRRADGEAPEHAVVRLLCFNVHPGNPRPDEVLVLVANAGVDVAVLDELPSAMVHPVQYDAALRSVFPHAVLRAPEGAWGGWRAILSRWPLRELPAGADGDGAQTGFGSGRLVVRLEAPGGAFVLAAVSPASPRTPARWADGLRGVRAIVEEARRWREDGATVIVAGDLNGVPGGARDVVLTGAGFLRARPRWAWQGAPGLLGLGGTFPEPVSRVVGVSIDDAWVSDGVRVRRWEALPGTGSDHRPVRIELVVPQGR